MKGDLAVGKELAAELGMAQTERKRSAADRALDYTLESCQELFHDQYGDPFIAFLDESDRCQVWPIKSKAAGSFIRWRFFAEEQKGLRGDALATARGALEARARFKGNRRELSLRVARAKDAFWYDLGDGRAVATTRETWTIIPQPPILFRRYAHQQPQVEPILGGTLDPFLDLLNVQRPSLRLLIKVYLVAALVPGISLPAVIVFGEQGTAKSTLFAMLRRALDPSGLKSLAPPDSLREFVQLAAHHRTVYLDNMSHLPDWLSDALCRLCTGEGFTKRELYSDDDDVVYSFRGLGGVNGISLVVTKPDLLDRGLLLPLEPIPDERRHSEAALFANLESLMPETLGAMCSALSVAMRLRPHITVQRLPRMADFSLWGIAIAQALGCDGQEFLDAYQQNVAAQNEAALDESLLARALLYLIPEGGLWSGTATDLTAALKVAAEAARIDVKARHWPKAPNAVTRRLREVMPNLRRSGFSIIETRTKGIVTWTISRQGPENIASIAITAPQTPVVPESSISLPAPRTSLPEQETPLPHAARQQKPGSGSSDEGGIPPGSTGSGKREEEKGRV